MARHAAKATTKPATNPAHDPKAVKAVKAAAPTPPACHPASADEIRLRAYLRWEAAGKPSGDGVRFWLEAEQELLQGK